MITVIFLFGPYPLANIEVQKQGPSSLPLIGAPATHAHHTHLCLHLAYVYVSDGSRKFR